MDEVTVQSWGTKERVDGNEKANDCLDRIIENYYPDVEPYSKEFLQIREAVMDANPHIYGKRTKAVSGGKVYTVSEDTKHNTIIYAGDKIKLVDANVTLKPATPKPSVEDTAPVDNTKPVEETPPVDDTPEVDTGAKNRAAYWQQQDEIEKNALSAIVAQTDETAGTQYQYVMEGFGLKGLGSNVKSFAQAVAPNWGDAKYPGDDASFDELESYYKAQAEAKRNALSALLEKAKDENTLQGFGLSGKTAELTSYFNGVSPNWGDRPFNPPKE